jgi:hypothetical protein
MNHLGGIRTLRNASAARSETEDYVTENIKLRQWALRTYGPHAAKDDDHRIVPRIMRADAIKMAQWWRDAADDVEEGNQIGNTVHAAVSAMLAAAYSDVAAAMGLRSLPAHLQAEELTWTQAAAFWRSMRSAAIDMGAAKLRPTLFGKGALACDSLTEVAAELPGRAIDAGKDLADAGSQAIDSVTEAMDRTVTTLKWTGAIGGGIACMYLLSRALPERKRRTGEDAS